MSALVLVAEDDPFNLRLLQEVCEAAGYRVVTAADGGQVLDVIARERPDVILLDVQMPVLDGFGVMRILKSDPKLAGIPIVVVTSQDDVDSKSRSIEAGAEDYVTKPYRVFEVQQRIRNALRLQAAQTAAVEFRESALVDPLTVAGTPQQLFISINYEFTRALRYGHPLTCLAVRIADYESLLDGFGREAVDSIMLQFARGLRTCIRSIDHLFRNKPGEFAAVLPETDVDGASVVLKRVEEAIEGGTLWAGPKSTEGRIQLAMASYPSAHVTSGDALLRAAISRFPQT